MTRRLVVEADGGSRGNPGVAGYGALVRDAGSGEVLAQRAEPLGRVSNNVAEYSGLLAGLRAAMEIDAGAQVEVQLDSKLVVEQMSGRWKIKHEDMRRLASQAADLAAAITRAGGSVRYRWVPREQNSAADALSNLAMDGRRVRTGPPATAASTAPNGPAPPGSSSGPEVLFDLCEAGQQAPPSRDPQVAVEQVAMPQPQASEATVRVVLVRHGVTDFTDRGLIDGRGGADPSLNQRGLTQARAAARGVRSFVQRTQARGAPSGLSAVTSSLTRGRQTGAAAADLLGVPVEIDADWDEQSFGRYDRASLADLVRAEPGLLKALRDDPELSWPGGESHLALAARAVAAFERAVARGGVVVVASHRNPIAAVLADVLGMPPQRIWSLGISPGSISVVEVWADGTRQVALVNDTHHLESPQVRAQPAR